MAIKKYKYPDDKDLNVAKHFEVGEFFQRDTFVGCGKLTAKALETYDEVLIDSTLVTLLEGLRDMYAKHYGGKCTISLTPHGGYRPTTLNKAVGGAAGSQHRKGTAADIIVKIDGKVMDVPTSAVLAERYMFDHDIKGGVGVYAATHSHFHVDVRGNWAAWYCSYSGRNCPAQGGRQCVFKSSNQAAGVVLIQRKLVGLGYDCGSADGKYGAKTANAVKQFQKANGLSPDGVYGFNTNSKFGVLPW